jgi:hypothetical protein
MTARAEVGERLRRRVVLAALELCRHGRGFCFTDSGQIADKQAGRRLEYAVAALKDHFKAKR